MGLFVTMKETKIYFNLYYTQYHNSLDIRSKSIVDTSASATKHAILFAIRFPTVGSATYYLLSNILTWNCEYRFHVHFHCE